MASKLENIEKAISAIDAKIVKLNHRKGELLAQAAKAKSAVTVTKGDVTHPSTAAVKSVAEKKEDRAPIRTDAPSKRPKGHYYTATEQLLTACKKAGNAFRDALRAVGYRAGGFADLAGLDENELKSIWDSVPASDH